MEYFTERFNQLIKENATQQSELSRILNVSRQAINDYCKGRNYPSIPVLVAICKFFNVSSDYLLGLSEY